MSFSLIDARAGRHAKQATRKIEVEAGCHVTNESLRSSGDFIFLTHFNHVNVNRGRPGGEQQARTKSERYRTQ